MSNPIVRFAVERRVTMAMAVLGVLVLGWLSLSRLPLEFLPEFSSSHISVTAPYPSSSPEETERLIVRPLEDSLGTVNGIETLTATATASSASVTIQFVDGTDMALPIRPDHRRLVSHRRHAGLRIEAAHDATRGRRRPVTDVSVAIDDDHLVAAASQLAAHRAANDAGTDDAGSHGSGCFSKNASVSAQASSAASAS